jgi:GTP-binding protein EngB required for normal cell division
METGAKAIEVEIAACTNIVVVGKSGSGKTALINALLGCELDTELFESTGATQISEPLTSVTRNHLQLFDTRGFELDKNNWFVNYFKDINVIVDNTKQHIHFVFYTVLASMMRFEEFEYNFVNEIKRQGIGIFIVMTKAIDDDAKMNAFESHIKSKCPDIDIVKVLSQTITTNGHQRPSFGLDELINLIKSKIPAQALMAVKRNEMYYFNLAIVDDRDEKVARARAIVARGMGIVQTFRLLLPGGGLMLWSHLCDQSILIAKEFEVVNVEWSDVLTASGVCKTAEGIFIHVPIFGPSYGARSTTSKYYDLLIDALEWLHSERHGDLNSVSTDDMVNAVVLRKTAHIVS